MPEPMVTTVLTTYRNPQLIVRAIESVLRQTFSNLRVCVYDNASDDETESVVARYAAQDRRVEYHRHPSNIGLVRNFQFGLSHVTTPYMSFLSDDDWLLPELYATGVRGLEVQPDAAFLSARVLHVDDDGHVVRQADITARQGGLHRPPQGLLDLLEHGAPGWTGTVFRTSALKRVGGLDAETGDLIDIDVVLRLAVNHPFVTDPRPGAVFSRRRDSVSGRLRLSSTWPGWPRMMANLDAQGSLTAANRDRAKQILTSQLITRLYGTGLGCSRRGNSEDARQAARILSETFGEHRRAQIVLATEFIFRRFPPLRAVMPRLGRRRLRYVRQGWRNGRVRLDRYLSQVDGHPR
jgi:hypothetical protein